MRNEYEIREYLDSLGEFSEERGVLEWILESSEEPKFSIGERVLYMGGYERNIVSYDSSDNMYYINGFTRDTWVNESELEKITDDRM